MWWPRYTPVTMCVWTFFVFYLTRPICKICLPSFSFLAAVSTQRSFSAICWPQTVCKTGSITTHSHSCTSGQGRQTHANAPKCASKYLHKHTCMYESSSASAGCRNRILEPLKIISDMGHEWLISLSEHHTACVYAKYTAAIFPWQNN